MKKIIILLIISFNIYAQENVFFYEIDFIKRNDAFNVTLITPQLSEKDNVYSFVSYAPGVHQPLDFGRFVKMFKVYDKDGNELLTNKISINNIEILDPTKVATIVYEIDDSFDMSTAYHPIYPMSGTGINESYIIINPHGVFGYFDNLKNNPIELNLKLEGNPKVGTALNLNKEGNYEVDSYYHLTDSPLLIGDNLSYASTIIDEIRVEAYVHSPSDKITAQMVLDEAKSILNAAKDFIGYSPVDRYTFLMYFASDSDLIQMPVFNSGGALEHSLSSTYALPDMPQYLPVLKNIIAHEFMHILSPLHLHSNVLANFDYSNPVSEDKHVWLYEGVTEWVSYIMQVKSGVVTIDDYLNYLSDKAINSDNYDSAYSLARISREWSTDEGNKQYGNIYQLGALTAAMLDIKLIQLSDGSKGLREVYLELIKKYGKENPFDNDTFFDTLVDMTYPEISDFIDKHIMNNTPFDFEKDFAAIGIKYFAKKISDNKEPLFGLQFGTNNNKYVIHGFSKEHKDFGLKVGDVVEKVFGEVVTLENSDVVFAKKKTMKAGDWYEIVVSRDGEMVELNGRLIERMNYYVLEIDEEASKEAQELRARWSRYFKS